MPKPGMLTVLSRQDTVRKPDLSEGFQGMAKILELLSVEKLLWKPTQVTATNKCGAESMKQKKQPCRNATCLAKQRPDAEHLAAWQGVCAFVSRLRGSQRRLWDL